MEKGFEEVERVMRVLIGDLWGDVAESGSGWRDEEDQKCAEKWAGEVPEVRKNKICSIFLWFLFFA